MRVIAFLLFSVATSVAAHPHVRLFYQVEPVLESGQVAGLRVLWRMDRMTSMLVAPGIAAFATENHRLPEYFTHLSDADQPLRFTIAAPLRADIDEDGIALRFELRLAAPVAPERLGVRFFDASWYVALIAAQPVLAGSAPCSASFRTSLLATQGWGTQAVPTIAFACKP
jgi:ABC-type uncharacterized transport system substrate-binding protein